MPTPPERGRSTGRAAIEPTHVQRRRRTEALAELVRQVREDDDGRDADEGYESVPLPPRGSLPSRRPLPAPSDDDTEELPPVPAAGTPTGARPRRRAALVVGAAAALTGLALAFLLPGAGRGERSRPGADARSATAPAAPNPSRAAPDPDGAGILRQGDSGPEVTALEQRLLRIPDVYEDGSTDGDFDAPLADAVARFQLWYGIRGDEYGVYGDDTRADLESRTTLP